MGGTNTGAPARLGLCTRVEEPTGDKTGALERRLGGTGGVSLGGKSSFYVLLNCKRTL